MTFGHRGHRSRRPPSTLTVTPREARILREAHALAGLELHVRTDGGREFRIPGSPWLPIEDLARRAGRDLQLAVPFGADKEES